MASSVSGRYHHFDAPVRMAIRAFRISRFLDNGSTFLSRIPRHLAAASDTCGVRVPQQRAVSNKVTALTSVPPAVLGNS